MALKLNGNLEEFILDRREETRISLFTFLKFRKHWCDMRLHNH